MCVWGGGGGHTFSEFAGFNLASEDISMKLYMEISILLDLSIYNPLSRYNIHICESMILIEMY